MSQCRRYKTSTFGKFWSISITKSSQRPCANFFEMASLEPIMQSMTRPGAKYIFTSTSVRVYECTSVRVYECTSVRVYECTSVRVYVCTSVRVYECTSVRVYECTSVRVYECTSVRVYECTRVRVHLTSTSTFPRVFYWMMTYTIIQAITRTNSHTSIVAYTYPVCACVHWYIIMSYIAQFFQLAKCTLVQTDLLCWGDDDHCALLGWLKGLHNPSPTCESV